MVIVRDRIGGSSQVMGRGERRPYPGKLEYLMKNKWCKHKPKAILYRQAGSAPENQRHRRQIQMQRQLTYLFLPKDADSAFSYFPMKPEPCEGMYVKGGC